MEVNITKERVESLLKEYGISKAKFASMMGVKRQNIDALLSSQKKDINMVFKMAEIFNMSLEEFAGIKKTTKKIITISLSVNTEMTNKEIQNIIYENMYKNFVCDYFHCHIN